MYDAFYVLITKFVSGTFYSLRTKSYITEINISKAYFWNVKKILIL